VGTVDWFAIACKAYDTAQVKKHYNKMLAADLFFMS
jgi:hypothetical protein